MEITPIVETVIRAVQFKIDLIVWKYDLFVDVEFTNNSLKQT